MKSDRASECNVQQSHSGKTTSRTELPPRAVLNFLLWVLIHFYFKSFKAEFEDWRDDSTVNALATKPSDLSLIPRAHRVGEK